MHRLIFWVVNQKSRDMLQPLVLEFLSAFPLLTSHLCCHWSTGLLVLTETTHSSVLLLGTVTFIVCSFNTLLLFLVLKDTFHFYFIHINLRFSATNLYMNPPEQNVPFTWILHFDNKLNPVFNLLLRTVDRFFWNATLCWADTGRIYTWQEQTKSCIMNLFIFLPDFLMTSKHFWVVTQMRLDTVQTQLPTPPRYKEHKKTDFCMVIFLCFRNSDMSIMKKILI